MQQTPFHAYYTARRLESLSDEDKLLPAFASSDIQVYPFQVAAASFALRSPYQKGAVLCDESGMGKSHEAMLVITQKWMEGQSHILLVIPNADLLWQWTQMIDHFYTIPYVVITNREQWNENGTVESPNAFEQNALVITTYEFAADHETQAAQINWDLTVFEEANALSCVYQEDSVQAKTLKRVAGNSFKLLLTGTPIEKNIMDLYGLIWFIDETILPDEREFLARYLRRPENYPELSERVSGYCFRTLRAQAQGYAKVPQRILITEEYTPSPRERKLYELLFAYINKPHKRAFPEMNPYDLALRLLGLLGSSTAALRQTIQGVVKRLEDMPDALEELDEWRRIQAAAEEVGRDAKADRLLCALQGGFALMKNCGANRKAVIFTESVETQKMLAELLQNRYKTLLYNGSKDYTVIQQFKESGEVLISTDHGARGFNLEEAAFVIHYDLLYNMLKMEQRIDRCHRLGQENDVLSLAFIDQNNFADVRKLELINKRMLVADGVFGVTDKVIGGFTDDLTAALEVAARRLRTKAEVEADYQRMLTGREEENKRLISSAEDVLFTTFTKELADQVTITPQYVEEKTAALDESLWEVVRWFFERYNDEHGELFAIDEANRTITWIPTVQPTVLFYYWDGRRNKKYRSLRAYGMAKDFKPRSGRITFSSILGRGVLHELSCGDSGTITVNGAVEPCSIGLYTVTLASAAGRFEREIPVLVGKTASGRTLTQDECKKILRLPVQRVEEGEHQTPHWLKSGGKPHALDRLVLADELVARQSQQRSPAQAEEIEKIKLRAKVRKNALSRELVALETQVKEAEAARDGVTNDRLRLLALDKKASLLRQEFRRRQESQFFDAMRLDLELEEQIKEFAEKEQLTAKVQREFIVKVEGAIQ